MGNVSVVDFEVDADLGARILEQPSAGGLVDHDRQQAILQRVVAEDIGDLGADHRAKAVIQQRPRRVLAR